VFGEHHTQLWNVGAAMYLRKPALSQSLPMMGRPALSISQPDPEPARTHQAARSLTLTVTVSRESACSAASRCVSTAFDVCSMFASMSILIEVSSGDLER